MSEAASPTPARRGVPLRVTLVAALLSLVALGLLASAVATNTALHNYLIARTDAQLTQDASSFVRRLDQPSFPRPGTSAPRPPSRYYVAVLDARGATVQVLDDPSAGHSVPKLTSLDAPSETPVTVRSVEGGEEWRVVTIPVSLAGGGTGMVAVAASLADVSSTVHRLVLLQTGIGLVVLLLLAVLGYLAVRRSLRPLAEVETTAVAIAAGDLHRRVPSGGSRTEVGRLSVALNGMLTQIQAAFDASVASEDAAKASELRMRRFVGDASHELRTPLTTIRGFAELYRQGAAADPAAVRHLLGRIESEAARMGVLVEDLLQLARLDAQRPLVREPVDLLTVASDAVHDAQAVAPQHTIRLEVLDGPGTPEVLGEEGRLRQVLSNLVTNALTHTPPGTAVTVRVGTQGTQVLLEVADNGPGLSTEDAERIFERFYRADESRARASGGSGLGLSIVAALVAAHGGSVSVDSRPGQGASFRVLLPRIPE